MTTYGTQTQPPARARLPRAVRLLVPALLVLGFALIVAVSPAARSQLRASFTQLPPEYTELSFLSDPTAADGEVRVPVDLVHHGRSTEVFTIRATVTPENGKAVSAETAVNAAPEVAQHAVLIVRAEPKPGSYAIEVALPGHPQKLSYHLGQGAQP